MALPNNSSEKLKQVAEAEVEAEAEEVEANIEEEQEVKDPPCSIDHRLAAAGAVNYQFGSISVDTESNIQLFNEPASSSSRSASTSIFTVVSSTTLLPVSCPNCSMPPGFSWSWPINVMRSSSTSPVVSSSPSEVVSISMAAVAASYKPWPPGQYMQYPQGEYPQYPQAQYTQHPQAQYMQHPQEQYMHYPPGQYTQYPPGQYEAYRANLISAQPFYPSRALCNPAPWPPGQYTHHKTLVVDHVDPRYVQRPLMLVESRYVNGAQYIIACPGYIGPINLEQTTQPRPETAQQPRDSNLQNNQNQVPPLGMRGLNAREGDPERNNINRRWSL